MPNRFAAVTLSVVEPDPVGPIVSQKVPRHTLRGVVHGPRPRRWRNPEVVVGRGLDRTSPAERCVPSPEMSGDGDESRQHDEGDVTTGGRPRQS